MYYSMYRLSRLDVKWADLFDANSGSFFAPHRNPYYELIVIAEGTVYLQVGDERMTMHIGDSILLMPWERHTGWNYGALQGRFFWAQFSVDPILHEFTLDRASELSIVHAQRTELRTEGGIHEDPVIIPRQMRSHANNYARLAYFEQLVDTMKNPKGYFRFRSTLLLAELLRQIADDFMQSNRLNTDLPASYITFRQLVNYLNNAYTSEIETIKLEKILDRKYEYLCQVFKRYAGTSIRHYIHQLRAQHAKHLLLNTAKTVKEIAEELGYEDSFYFSRIFKRIVGTAPQHYRQMDQS